MRFFSPTGFNLATVLSKLYLSLCKKIALNVFLQIKSLLITWDACKIALLWSGICLLSHLSLPSILLFSKWTIINLNSPATCLKLGLGIRIIWYLIFYKPMPNHFTYCNTNRCSDLTFVSHTNIFCKIS